MKLKERFFDFEVFPNWWCCVVGDYPEDDNIDEGIKDDFMVFRSDDPDASRNLLMTVQDQDYCYFGYYNKRYDNIILNGVANGFSPRQLKILSDILNNPDVQYQSPEAMRIAPFARRGYDNFIFQDMLDDNTGSLKEKEACMQLDIRESTIPFDQEELTEEDIQEVISYCCHDVWSGMNFYKRVLKSFVATKLLVGRVFDIPMGACYKSTNATLSGRVLAAKKSYFTDNERADIEIPKELEQYIKYSLPQNVVDRLCSSPEKFKVKLFGNIVSYSNGGIHSVPFIPGTMQGVTDGTILAEKTASRAMLQNLQVESNDDWVMINVDAASFYPALMIFWNYLSRAVTKPELFKEMYETRLRFKAEGNTSQEAKDISQAYKLILNTTYGASGNKWLALFDPYMTTSTCRIGQLVLTALANNIYNQIGKDNVQVVQTNTDGVLVYIRRTHVDMLHKIGDTWTEVTQILLEYEEEEITWQRDVNNYILYKKSGAEKSKGGYFVTDMIQPGYNRVRPLNNYVVRDAIKWYLKERKDIVEHIFNETDLSKFVITCSKGNGSGIVREFNNGDEDEVLHKCNRAYASLNKDFGEIKILRKRLGIVKKFKAPDCPPHCGLVNEALDTYDFSVIREDIDYMYYIERAAAALSEPWYEMRENKIIPIKIYEE